MLSKLKPYRLPSILISLLVVMTGCSDTKPSTKPSEVAPKPDENPALDTTKNSIDYKTITLKLPNGELADISAEDFEAQYEAMLRLENLDLQRLMYREVTDFPNTIITLISSPTLSLAGTKWPIHEGVSRDEVCKLFGFYYASSGQYDFLNSDAGRSSGVSDPFDGLVPKLISQINWGKIVAFTPTSVRSRKILRLGCVGAPTLRVEREFELRLHSKHRKQTKVEMMNYEFREIAQNAISKIVNQNPSARVKELTFNSDGSFSLIEPEVQNAKGEWLPVSVQNQDDEKALCELFGLSRDYGSIAVPRPREDEVKVPTILGSLAGVRDPIVTTEFALKHITCGVKLR